MQLDQPVLPLRGVATGALEPWGRAANQPVADQYIAIWMADIMTPENHLLGQAAGGISQLEAELEFGHGCRNLHLLHLKCNSEN